MQLTKYKLGDLIAQRREKNKDYNLPIRGVSKEGFIKPKIEEADTSIYNVFYKNDFVFNPARMELNSIALNLDLDKALCSSLYEVFYVKDEKLVLPEFLNLHIKRDEFARHCDYIGLGSAREYCRFANIAEFDIKIPPIEVQREIVQADRQIKRRIRLNEQMIEKLEATAQALYRKMFVDGIDKENLPEGWRMGTIGEFCDIITGKKDVNESLEEGIYRFFSCSPDYFYSNEYIAKGPAALIAGNGSYTGRVTYYDKEFDLYQRTYACIPHEENKELIPFLYCVLKYQFEPTFMGGSRGSSIPYIVRGDIADFEFVYKKETCLSFSDNIGKILLHIQIMEQENSKLSELQSLLLAKMGNLKL